jgi:pimeloyl-ACP methyl ester carboxylesterase
MRRPLLALTAALALAPAAARALEFTPCRLAHPSGLASAPAECAQLDVPEDATRPDGRRIALRIARVRAVRDVAAADPLFVLAGGPGAAATEFYAGVAPAFSRIRRDRDLVLVDQRGTGGSNALTCDFDDEALLSATPQALREASRACRDALAARADLAQYTTSIAVQDLERVRAALGYERISLYGVSYGTRVAQHYARRHRDRTRALILDGVIPAGRVLGPDIAIVAEAALASILDRCRQDATCLRAFGAPETHYRALRATLARASVPVTFPDPLRGAPREVDFGAVHLATVLRLSSYASDQAALLPLALHAAHVGGNFVPLATQYVIAADAVRGQVAYGMHNSVVCAEDVARYGVAPADRGALEATYLGTSQIEGLYAICRDWPLGPVDADLHAPLRTDVPALLLSGGADPVTPAEDGARAADGFADALHVVIPGMGHGQLGVPCMDRLMARFLERGGAGDLDVSCLRAVRPAPFFTSLAGPAP